MNRHDVVTFCQIIWLNPGVQKLLTSLHHDIGPVSNYYLPNTPERLARESKKWADFFERAAKLLREDVPEQSASPRRMYKTRRYKRRKAGMV